MTLIRGSRTRRLPGMAAFSSTQTARPVGIYYASVPLDTGKTVASAPLPTLGSGAGNGVNAMRIFAISAGSGTLAELAG